MPALPYLQGRESDSPVSSEKGPYRLSLLDGLPKTAHQANGRTRDSANVNKSGCYSQEETLLFEGANNVYLRDVHHFRTPLPTPSASRNSKRTLRTQDNPGQPTWVEPLGIWLPNKQKWNQYETFSKHLQLLQRTSDAFLDPFPHIPRCSHERTISALRRQRHRLETEGELKRLERNMRIIERVQQIREVWEKWTKQANNFGAEHKNRLDNFRKTRDVFIDPGEIIREKREERLHRERELQQERERKRREMLEKKRSKLPKIIVTQYEEDIKQEQNQTVLPSLGNIPRASGQNNDTTDFECRRGSGGTKLEVPQTKRVLQNEYDNVDEEIGSEQNASHSSEQSGEVGNARASEGNDLAVELESVVLEDNETYKLVETVVAQSVSISEPLTADLVSKHLFEASIKTLEVESQLGKRSNAFKNELEEDSINSSEQSGRLELDERDTIREKEIYEDPYRSEKNMNGSFYESEKGRELKEKPMNYLLPPSVSSLVGERFLDNGSIGDADDTASLMATFTPVPLGVGNGTIPNDAIRASSVFDRYHVPSQARLNNSKDGRKGGAWKPKISDQKQYLEVDLGAVTNVMQVATQGCPCVSNKVPKKDKCWVESFVLSFSTDGSNWRHCTENGAVKVFRGNADNNSVVLNSIPQPEEARFVRFVPQSWKNSIAMRVEVYGEVPEPDMSNVTPVPESRGVPQEVIVEEQEQDLVQEFLCDAELEPAFYDEQDRWEEEPVQSVADTASELQSQVATVSGSLPLPSNLAVQGETASKTKRKPRKLREENTDKNKKKLKKKVKEKMTTLPTVVTSLSLLGDVEEEEVGHSSEDEHEEERPLSSPAIPEVHKRPESVKRMSPAATRQFSMFPVRKESQKEASRPRRRRAQSDDSIRSELLRQQLAEDRRRKLEEAMSKTKRDVKCQSPVLDNFGGYGGLDDFLAKYCIISEGQAKYYRRIFNNFDDDKDGFLFAEDILEALESVNSNLLSDSHLNYIYRVLELCDCSLHSGADFKLFSVIAAFSQRVAVLDEFAKILISNLDFRELDYKLQRAKRLFLCYVDEEKKTISLEELLLGLTAGGLTDDQKEQTLQVLGRTACLDFLDFLTYIPLFIHIHDHILQDPVGTVVYRSYLAT